MLLPSSLQIQVRIETTSGHAGPIGMALNVLALYTTISEIQYITCEVHLRATSQAIKVSAR